MHIRIWWSKHYAKACGTILKSKLAPTGCVIATHIATERLVSGNCLLRALLGTPLPTNPCACWPAWQQRLWVQSISVTFKHCVFRGFSWRLCSANMRLVENARTTFSIFWVLVCVSEEILIFGIKIHLVLVLVHWSTRLTPGVLTTCGQPPCQQCHKHSKEESTCLLSSQGGVLYQTLQTFGNCFWIFPESPKRRNHLGWSGNEVRHMLVSLPDPPQERL